MTNPKKGRKKVWSAEEENLVWHQQEVQLIGSLRSFYKYQLKYDKNENVGVLAAVTFLLLVSLIWYKINLSFDIVWEEGMLVHVWERCTYCSKNREWTKTAKNCTKTHHKNTQFGHEKEMNYQKWICPSYLLNARHGQQILNRLLYHIFK